MLGRGCLFLACVFLLFSGGPHPDAVIPAAAEERADGGVRRGQAPLPRWVRREGQVPPPQAHGAQRGPRAALHSIKTEAADGKKKNNNPVKKVNLYKDLSMQKLDPDVSTGAEVPIVDQPCFLARWSLGTAA